MSFKSCPKINENKFIYFFLFFFFLFIYFFLFSFFFTGNTMEKSMNLVKYNNFVRTCFFFK